MAAVGSCVALAAAVWAVGAGATLDPTNANAAALTQNVYVSDNSGISELPAGGAAQQPLLLQDNSAAAGLGIFLSLAVDAAGNLYQMPGCVAAVSAGAATCIRTTDMVAAGAIGGVLGYEPTAAAVDGAGNVFFSDTDGNVFELPADGGPIVTVASGLNQPKGIAVDPAGDLFVADTGNLIVGSSGRVIEFPASGPEKILASGLDYLNALAVDSSGDVLVTEPFSNKVLEIFQNGTQVVRGQGFKSPDGVAVDANNNVYVADSGNNRIVELPVGGGPQVTLSASVTNPQSVAVQPLWSAPAAPTALTASAGNTQATLSWSAPGDDGGSPVIGYVVTPYQAGVAQPQRQLSDTATSYVATGLTPNVAYTFTVAATNAAGNSLPSRASTAITPKVSATIYVADRVDDHLLTVPAGGGANSPFGSGFSHADGVATDGSGNTFVADTDNDRVLKYPHAGGSPVTVGTGLSRPEGVAADPAGDVFIADTANSRVVEVPAGGGPQTTVGSGLSYPTAVVLDSAGDLFIADTGNNRIVEISVKSGVGQTTLGSGLSIPTGVALDTAGDIYVADSGNNRVVEIPAGGGAQTTVGSGFNQPQGVAVDASGNVYVADTGNNRVVAVPAGGGTEATILAGVGGPHGIAAQAGATAPTAPTGVSGVASDRQVTLTWSPPVDDGGTPVTGYLITPFTAGVAGSPITVGDTSAQFTVTGLSDGTAYTFSVAAMNAVGTGGSSLASAAIVPAASSARDLYFTQSYPSKLGKWPANGGSPALIADIGQPLLNSGLAVDGAGDVFVADTENNRILEVRADGTQTVIGHSVYGPTGVAVDAAGDVFILQYQDESGGAPNGPAEIVEVPGNGAPDRVVFSTGRADSNLPNDFAGIPINAITAVAADPAGNVYLGLSGTVVTTNVVGEIAANGGTQTVLSSFGYIGALAVDATGDVFVADEQHNDVVEVPVGGSANKTIASGSLDIGYGLSAPLADVDSVAVDSGGNVWFNSGSLLYKVAPGAQPLDVSNSLRPSIPDFAKVAVQPSATAPSAPLQATGSVTGAGQVTVNWQPPNVDGGQPITGYTVTAFTSSGTVATTASVPAPASSGIVNGLPTTGVFTFEVSAANSVGTGPPSLPTGPSNMAIGTPVGPTLATPWRSFGPSSSCTSATYTVPVGVYWVRVQAVGAAGGAASNTAGETWFALGLNAAALLSNAGDAANAIAAASDLITLNLIDPTSGNAGGPGAAVDGELQVTPGQTLYLTVGQPGVSVNSNVADGFPGGGEAVGAGGGGGLTMVSSVAPTKSNVDGTSGEMQCVVPAKDLLVVAGGGGGAGAGELFGDGHGGGGGGVLSYNWYGTFTTFGAGQGGGGNGGGGGTATAGGDTDPCGGFLNVCNGGESPGSLLVGGPNIGGGGGGGGGGYYGGGPGSNGAHLNGGDGGGGGSSYVAAGGVLIGSSLATTGPMAAITPMSGSATTPTVSGVSDPCVGQRTCSTVYPADAGNLPVYNTTVNAVGAAPAGVGVTFTPGMLPNGVGYETYWYSVDNSNCAPTDTADCSGSFTSRYTIPAGAAFDKLNQTGPHTVYVFGQTITGFQPVEPVETLSFVTEPTPANSTNTPAPPHVTSDPANTATAPGGVASFTAAATGNPAPTVQWQYSADGSTGWSDIPGATTATYSFSTALSDSGTHFYRAAFTNSTTVYTKTASLTFQPLPVITVQPVTQTVVAGQTVTFSADAQPSTSDATLASTVQWQQSNDGVHWSAIAGAAAPTYSFTPILGQNGTQFRAVFTDAAGSTATAAAGLIAQAAPVVTLNPNDQTLPVGAIATFTADATGNPPPTVQWQVSAGGGAWADVVGATSPAVSVAVTAGSAGNSYRAVFWNVAGSSSTTAAAITVATPPAVTTQPQALALTLGAAATFTAAASGSPAPDVQWQVSSDGGATWQPITGANSGTFTVTPAASDSGRLYEAVFTNAAGTATTTAATLTVTAAPTVVLQPEDTPVDNGLGVTFGAVATGVPTPTQQWQVSTDGVHWSIVDGATGPTLAVTATPTDDQYEYQSVFTNSSGTVTTRAATLTVHWVQITQQVPQDVLHPGSGSCPTVLAGAPVTLTAAAAGDPTPTVQWYRNQAVIPGATSSSYTFTTTAADVGNAPVFTARFTGSTGNSAGANYAETSCSLPVWLPVAPSILQNETDSGIYNWQQHEQGGQSTITLFAISHGMPEPTATWQQSTDGGQTWIAVASGVTTQIQLDSTPGLGGYAQTQRVWSPTRADDGSEYRVLFANSAGAVTTTPIVLVDVPAAPAVTGLTSGDRSITVNWTGPSLSDSGGSPIVNYNVVATPINGGSSISTQVAAPATSATVSGLTNGLFYSVTVAAVNAIGTGSASAAQKTFAGTTPTPTSLTLTPQYTATIPIIPIGGSFAFTATGFDGLGNSVGDVSAATTFTIAPVYQGSSSGASCAANVCTAGVAGDYSVKGTDGTATGTELLFVWPPPTVRYNAADETGPMNWPDEELYQTHTSSITLREDAVATGDIGTNYGELRAPTATWQVSTDGGQTWTAIANGVSTSQQDAGGETLTSLTFSPSHQDDGNEYRVVFANAGGTATTDPPVVIGENPGAPVITHITPGNGSIGLSWSASADTGGTPITGWEVSGAPTTVVVPGSATSTTITGLSNGSVYQLSVIAESATGFSPSSDYANVVPGAPAPGSLTVNPASAAVIAGGTVPISATDATGDVTGATTFTIDPLDFGTSYSGASCTANVCTGMFQGTYEITGTDGSETGTAYLYVSNPTSLSLSPSSTTIVAGGSATFSATGSDLSANSSVVTGGTSFTIAPNGSGSATGASCTANVCTATAAGTYVVGANDGTTNTLSGMHPATASATLIVKAAAPAILTLGQVSPSITTGGSTTFTASGVDAYGNNTGDVTGGTSFTIAPAGSGSATGASCTANACTAAVAGTYRVTGTNGTATATANLTVYSTAAPVSLMLTPGSATTVAGVSKTFTAAGVDGVGNSTGDVTGATTFTIAPYGFSPAANGSCGVSSCSATVAGTYLVTGTDGSVTGTAVLTVNAAAPASLTLSPLSATIAAGGSGTFGGTATDVYDNTTDATAATSFTIAPNGSGSATGASCSGNACTATAAGTYLVTGVDGSTTAAAALTVTAGPMAGLALSPSSATIAAGASKAFSAFGIDAQGNATGGLTLATTFTIAPAGSGLSTGASCTLSACTATVAGTYLVTGTYGGSTASATLTVNPAAPARLTLSPRPATIPAGGSKTFNATGIDAEFNDTGDMTGATTFTIAPVGFNPGAAASCAGDVCTATVAGTYLVTGADGSATGIATLTVTPAAPTGLTLSPASASVAAGGSETFSATGVDAFGNSTGDVSGATSFAIAPHGSGSATGATCNASVCTATVAGSYLVTGSDGGETATALLTVTAGPAAGLALSPASATIAAGASETLTAAGFDAYGNGTGDVTGATGFAIAPHGSGSATGASCIANACTATVAGSYLVTGTDGVATGTALLTVTADPIAALLLSPASSSILAGGSQMFTAAGIDGYGNSTGDVTGATSFAIAPVGFSPAGGASCTANVCTSPVAGTYLVTGTNGSATGTADLTVTPAAIVSWTSATTSTPTGNNAALGVTATDAAALTGTGPTPTGTVDFYLCSPTEVAANSGDCSSGGTKVGSTKTVDGSGAATSDGATSTSALGKYCWRIEYAGDGFYAPAAHTDSNAECFTTVQATPTLVTSASPGVTVGGSLSDTATLSGGFNPSGTITFDLYGPNPTTCTGAAAATVTASVTAGNGTYTSPAVPEAQAGSYEWVATYSGDTNNNAIAPGSCTDPAEGVAVAKAGPILTTAASAGAPVGGSISDDATLAAGFSPNGTITFTVYGPDDPTCTTVAKTLTVPVTGNGIVSSGAFTPSQAGTYRWLAAYGGDANNIAAGPGSCADPAETVVVAKAATGLTTQASPSVAVGGSITDTATLSGGVGPTGSIAFRLYGAGDTNCAHALATSSASVSGNGSYRSDGFTTTVPGTYEWVASYSGDPNNASTAPSSCADPSESVVVTSLAPAMSTHAAAGTGVPGESATDTATVGGSGPMPSGTVTFFLCQPVTVAANGGDCSAGGTQVGGAMALVNGQATSAATTSTTVVGSYCWRTEYSGDVIYDPATHTNATNECFTVASQLPTVATSSSPTGAGVVPGTSATDLVTVSGAGLTPTGTATFFLCDPTTVTANGCASGGTQVGAATTLDANGKATSDTTTATTTVGTYCWRAEYSGDTRYDSASHTDSTAECFTTAMQPATIQTQSSPAGPSVTDSATVGGVGPTPTGTVTFYLCGPASSTANGCASGGTQIGAAKTLDGTGNATSDVATAINTPGTWCWRAEYSGDQVYNAGTETNSTTECFTMPKQASSTATQVIATAVSATDGATVSGSGPTPTGSVSFFLCKPSTVTANGGDCRTGGTKIGASKPLDAGGKATSDASAITQADGTYCWRAEYSGDDFYLSSTEADPSSECFTPSKQDATIATSASPTGGSVVPGTSATDSTTVSGAGPTPTGSVMFFLCNPATVTVNGGDCSTGGAPVGAAKTLDPGGQATSSDATAAAIGTYCWRAEYSGDGFYNTGSHTNATGECFTTVPQTPTVATSSSPTGGGLVPGAPATDTATVTGVAGTPTGSVTFFLCDPSIVTVTGCTSGGTQVGVAKTLDGNGQATSAAATATTVLGTYCWRAEYSGDGVYNPALHTDATAECFTTASQAATISTTSSPTGSGVAPGTHATDAVTVSGGAGTPTGTVTFFLCDPSTVTANGCPSGGTQVGAATTLGASGQATSAAATAATAVGSYCWRAEYSGDVVYGASNHTNSTTECFQTAILSTKTAALSSPSGGGVVPGTAATETATVANAVTGGPQPTGSVTFFLCGPVAVSANGGNCSSGGTQVGGAATLVNAQANSNVATDTSSIGVFCWRAVYPGDAAHAPSSDAGSSGECFTTVTQPSTISTQSSTTGSTVATGTSVTDTATLTGPVGTPAGTVTFFLCQPQAVTANGGNCSAGGAQVGAAKTLDATGHATSDSTSNTTAIGTYCWRAVYSGGGLYKGSTEPGSATECFTTVAAGMPADLSISATASSDTVPVNGVLTYTLTVRNAGPGSATGVSVIDPLPATTTFVSAASSQGSCAQAAGIVTCSVGAIAKNGSATVTVKVTPTKAGAISNTASVSGSQPDPKPSNNSDSVSTDIVGPDLSVTVTGSPDSVLVNATLTYTIAVHNGGPGSATGVTVTDPLPPTVTFVSASPSQGSCAFAAGTLTCNMGALANGRSGAITIKVTPAQAGRITNTANVIANETDPSAGDNSDNVTTKVIGPTLSIETTAAPDPVAADATLTYTITVHNSGPGSATAVTVTDPLPATTSYRLSSASQGSCSQAAGTVTCNLGTLANGSSATITIKVTPTRAGEITNTAAVSANETDPQAANTDSTRTKVVATEHGRLEQKAAPNHRYSHSRLSR